MMSMITPPVALAAFAAAAITGAKPMETGVAAMRIGWAAYVIPFAFVSTPALLLQGSASEVALVLAQTAVCVFAVSVSVVGHFSGRMGLPARAFLGSVGLAGMPLFSGAGAMETVSFVLAATAFASLAVLYMQARQKAAV
jgi:TRAP-type uncharacterized transport system fused permease subunit